MSVGTLESAVYIWHFICQCCIVFVSVVYMDSTVENSLASKVVCIPCKISNLFGWSHYVETGEIAILFYDFVITCRINIITVSIEVSFLSVLFNSLTTWCSLFLSDWCNCCGEQCGSVLCTQSVRCGWRHEESTGCLQAGCGDSGVRGSKSDCPQNIGWETDSCSASGDDQYM